MSKRKRGQRGVASCKEKLREDQMKIQFNELQLPIGPNASKFDSQLGLALRAQLPYWKNNKDIGEEKWKKLWLEIKETWHIPNDDAEIVTIIRAKQMRRNFFSKLYRKYLKTKENPCPKYTYFDSKMWEEFVKSRSTDEALEKSAKARLSSFANKHPARTGRSGYRGLKQNFHKIWPSLMESNSILKNLDDERCQLLVAARRKKDPQTGNYDTSYYNATISKMIDAEKQRKPDGTYGDGRSDPITQIFGPKHGGRTRAVSSAIGRTRARGYFNVGRKRVYANLEDDMSHEIQNTDAVLGFRGSSCDSGGSHIIYPDVENLCRCELLWSFDSRSAELTLANGRAFPTCDRYLDDILMQDHCVKVQVDYVHQEYLCVPVPSESFVKDEIEKMEHTIDKYIQWPRRAIKILNTSTHSASRQSQILPQTSTCDIRTSAEGYIPEMQHSSEVHNQLETNTAFVINNAFLDDMDNDSFLGTSLNVFEQPQTQHVQQLLTTSGINSVQKSQSRQPKPKQTRVRQNKAKAKGKQAGGKLTYQELQAKNVDIALEKMKTRPRWHQNMVHRLQNHIGNNWIFEMHYSVADEMFPTEIDSFIEPEPVLQLFVNGWVDISIMFLFTSYFYEASSKRSNPCAFLNTNTISGDRCSSHRKEVEEHIYSLYSQHADKEYFLAPYLANNHWSLFIIAPQKEQVYILDSLLIEGQKNESDYLLSEVIQSALSEVNFTWTMVSCKQQESSWECGYMVIKYMFDYVFSYQKEFPNLMWQDTSVAKETDIENLLKNLMPHLFRKLRLP